MDFAYTEEQLSIKRGIREWSKEWLSEQVIADGYKNRGIAPEVAKAWVDSGWGLYGLPEEYGGKPTDHLTMAMIVEELNHAGGNIPMAPNLLIMFDMAEFGSPQQLEYAMDYYKEYGYPPYCLAISEPEAGSDNQGMTTTATRGADGKLHINGVKTWVTSGESSAGFIVVCKDEDPSRDNKEMSMYLVAADAPGVTIEPLNKIGMQIMPFSMIHLEDVVVSDDALLGVKGKGFMQLMKNFEWERCVLLAELLGEAQAAMDDACAWVNERRQFDKGIKTFQLVQEHIVEMQISLSNVRNFLYRTCWKLDNGIPVNNDAAMLKRYGAPALTDVCSRALQLMGGLGFTDQTRVSRLMLDCRGFQIGGGTVEIMVHISGRGILKEYLKTVENQDYLYTI
jgi:alkylation response protein AidB-like acyl-CoA dehydrogenase